MFPTYPSLPRVNLLPMILDVLRGKQRLFRDDAQRLTAAIRLSVSGNEHIPQAGPAVLVLNHYHRPGFQAFWFALAISAVIPIEVHWMITGAWTDDKTSGAWLRARISPYILPRVAKTYGFTSMPPMPPRAYEITARATAVRHILLAARQSPPPILGLAPEGQDNPTTIGLMRPPPGVGRLVAILNDMGYALVPVGVFEKEQSLALSFGAPFQLNLPEGLGNDQRDQMASNLVMKAIAVQLPVELRGEYS